MTGLFRFGAMVSLGNVFEMAAGLFRSILLARLLPVEDFAIAATFAMLLMLMETSQNAGLNRLVVQDQRGGTHEFLASVHGVQLLLGGLTAIGLALIAWPYARVMNTQGVLLAYLALAVVPLIRGFTNLEVCVAQRHGDFRPYLQRAMLAQSVGLIVIWPAYLLFGDYRIMLVSILAQQIVGFILTHIRAGGRFAIRFDPEIRRQVLAFGWPLMLNCFFMFGVLNGDRIIVSNQFGLTALGWFSAAAMVATTPVNFMINSSQALLLPIMARFQDDTARLQHYYERLGGGAVLIGTAMVIGAALIGQWAMALVFGDAYAVAAPYLLLLMIGQAIRLSRVPASMAAMARAETRNMLYANIVRAIFIPVALLVALHTGAIVMMMTASIIGELIVTLATGHLIEQRVRLRAVRLYQTVLLQAAICASTVIATVYPLGWLATVVLTVWLLYQQRAVLALIPEWIGQRRR